MGERGARGGAGRPEGLTACERLYLKWLTSRPKSGLDCLICAEFARQRELCACGCPVRDVSHHIQGYLAHKKPPPPLGPSQKPRHCPTVGSYGVVVSYARYPCRVADLFGVTDQTEASRWGRVK